jgi:hypothetical protein
MRPSIQIPVLPKRNPKKQTNKQTPPPQQKKFSTSNFLK